MQSWVSLLLNLGLSDFISLPSDKNLQKFQQNMGLLNKKLNLHLGYTDPSVSTYECPVNARSITLVDMEKPQLDG